jgi:phosphoribosyl 1,2-cyclic phosphodiesterase
MPTTFASMSRRKGLRERVPFHHADTRDASPERSIARVKPKRAILTNLHSDMDYESLRTSLPPGVEPGYDGMTLSG